MTFKNYFRTEVFISLITSLVLLCFISGCGGRHHGTEVYKLYTNLNISADDIASIILSSTDTKGYVTDYVDWIIIGNIRLDHKKYGIIEVVPGSYNVEWGRKFDISPMIKASGSEKRKWSTNLTLEAGHKYTIHAKRTVGHGYKIYSWITDDTQDIIIWGNQFVPGPYYYYLRDNEEVNRISDIIIEEKRVLLNDPDYRAKKLNEPCKFHSDCIGDLRCVENICSSLSHYLRRHVNVYTPPNLREIKNATIEEKRVLLNDPDYKAKKLNEPCKAHSDCVGNLMCRNNVCRNQ